MANFAYEYVESGKVKKSTIEANDLEQARGMLKDQGKTITKIDTASALDTEINFGVKKKITPRELGVMCKQFVSILQAGVPIITALEMLYSQATNPTLKEDLEAVRNDVAKGESLAGALENCNDFPDILINMVAAGEASGSLEIAFERMSTHFEKDARLKGMMKKAMIYPIVVCVVAVVVVIIMMVVVIPNFVGMFADMGTELPAITKFVMNMSDFIINKWYIIVGVVIALVVAYKIAMQQENVRYAMARLMLVMPIFGNMTAKTACARFARQMSTLMAAGMPIIDAIDITAKTMDNLLYKDALMDAKEQVAKGVPLSQPLVETGLFPAMICQMTKIGEETGNIEEMLDKCAEYYDEEVEIATQSLTAALEPLIIVVLAGIVGVIVIAVMSPMFSMYNAVDSM